MDATVVVVALLLFVAAASFASLDLWYFLRAAWLKLRYFLKRRLGRGGSPITEADLFRPYLTHGIVLPSDLDLRVHMNNSRYLREMDFGRIGLLLNLGVIDILNRRKSQVALNAVSVRYRRSLHVMERFVLSTQVLCWEEDALYLEQRITRCRDNFLSTIMFVKMVVRGSVSNIDELIRELVGRSVTSPRLPPEIENWTESIRCSSEALKKERLLREGEVRNHFVLPRKPH